MPYYKSSDEWLQQSQLLLEARPSTTRITTKYSIKVPKTRKPKPAAASSSESSAAAPQTQSQTPKPPRGSLTFKTYDPRTGTALKYRTTKAQEVSRLMLALGRLGRPMAGLPELKDESMPDAPDSGTGTPAVEKSEAAAAATVVGAGAKSGAAAGGQSGQGQVPQGGSGGGKGKKKKGKK